MENIVNIVVIKRGFVLFKSFNKLVSVWLTLQCFKIYHLFLSRSLLPFLPFIKVCIFPGLCLETV